MPVSSPRAFAPGGAAHARVSASGERPEAAAVHRWRHAHMTPERLQCLEAAGRGDPLQIQPPFLEQGFRRPHPLQPMRRGGADRRLETAVEIAFAHRRRPGQVRGADAGMQLLPRPVEHALEMPSGFGVAAEAAYKKLRVSKGIRASMILVGGTSVPTAYRLGTFTTALVAAEDSCSYNQPAWRMVLVSDAVHLNQDSSRRHRNNHRAHSARWQHTHSLLPYRSWKYAP